MDILTGEICRKYSLLIWTSFISQFVHPVGGERMGQRKWEGRLVILAASCFTLSENMKIWCKIQVMIFPFLKSSPYSAGEWTNIDLNHRKT